MEFNRTQGTDKELKGRILMNKYLLVNEDRIFAYEDLKLYKNLFWILLVVYLLTIITNWSF